MNRVEIMGKVSHLETTFQEIDGENTMVLRFVVEIPRENSKTLIDTIPCRVTGAMAEDVQKDIENGKNISVKGRWNVDKILSANGDVIHYCTCIPQCIMVPEEKGERGNDLSIR